MPTSNEPLPNLLFEYRGADFVLRSHDSHHFRIPKAYIVNSSPVLEELIVRALDSPNDAHSEAALPVVQLPESGAILHSLLTFVFPVMPLLPSTTEKVMELLSVAQKYQMVSILAHIRLSTSQHCPPSNRMEPALHIYSLAHKYGVHQEALQAAQTISKYPVTIEDLEDKLDAMQGTSLYDLWKYYEKARAILASDLTELRTSTSGVRSALGGLRCSVSSGSSQIPRWLDDYIKSVGDVPHVFDFVEFNMALARHIRDGLRSYGCSCASMSNQTIRNVWDALAPVVRGSFEKVCDVDVDELFTTLMSCKAGLALSHLQGSEDSQALVNSTIPLPGPLDISLPDANLVIRSADLGKFRVHKSILAIVSPFFRDLLSLPQPSDCELVDGLPVVQLSEDTELLNSLVSMLYPVRRMIPNSHEKVLNLLAACQKYDMVQVQSYIRAEIDRGIFPAPVGTEAFRAYAITGRKGLIPEMEKAARLTLDHPMTFETLGEALRLFDGRALRDLARFRRCCRDNLVMCLKSFLETQGTGASGRGSAGGCSGCGSSSREFSWLGQVISRYKDSKKQLFADPLPTPSNIRGEYLKALPSYANSNHCGNCAGRVRAANYDPPFCAELESKLAQALDKVHTFLRF